jgi:hypothetical protein
MGKKNGVKKIIIELEDGTQEEYIEGLLAYTVNNDTDMEARFANITEKRKLIAMSNAIRYALQTTIDKWEEAEQAGKKKSDNNG